MCELLAPAGSYESIRAAVNAGADAVYAGGRLFGARAYADNPDEEHLIRGIEYCHLHGRKLYLTVNTLLKEEELEDSLYPYLRPYYESGLDAVIVQDFGVLCYIREFFPGLPIHASTQMTVTGPEGARLLQREGVVRVVPARELSLKEVRAIAAQTGMETETFIHGAMCYSYSGQCLFSSMLGGRSGNRGRCAQPCRLPYRVSGGASGDGKTACLLSMKDMCTLDLLPDLIGAGISSFKIEGRMKRPEYTAGVVHVYRKYIDLCRDAGPDAYRVEEDDRRILLDLYNRGGFSRGYYRTGSGREMMSMRRPNHMGTPALRVDERSGSRLKMTALVSLGKGDVVELAPGRETTLQGDVREGARVTLAAGKDAPGPGGIVCRIRNERLLRWLSERYLAQDAKTEIGGTLTVRAGSLAVLRLECRGIHAEAVSEIAEPAVSQPTSAETLERQMRKTGGTPFVFGDLSVRMDGGLFVPVGRLNELRREGLARLEEAILAAGRREAAPKSRKASGEPVPEGMMRGGEAVQRKHTQCEPSPATDPGMYARTDTGMDPGMYVQTDIGADAGENVCPDTGTNVREENAGRESARTENTGRDGARISILVTTGEQLDAVAGAAPGAIDTIYLDSLMFGLLFGISGRKGAGARRSCPDESADGLQRARALTARVRQMGCRCFLNCPPVLRDMDRRLLTDARMQEIMAELDGFLLHTIDQLAFFRDFIRERGLRAELAADDSLYAYNRRAVSFLRGQGVGRITLPAELNYRELRQLSTENAELVVYGYQALMQSAQCVVKNTSGCTGTPAVTYLRDRKGASFPVLNRCPVCCNTIYNSVPLMLCGCGGEIERLAPAHLRLSFTVESAEETARALQSCMALLRGSSDGRAETGKRADVSLTLLRGTSAGRAETGKRADVNPTLLRGARGRRPDTEGGADMGWRAEAGTRGHFKRGVE